MFDGAVFSGQQGTSHCTKEFSVRLLQDFIDTA